MFPAGFTPEERVNISLFGTEAARAQYQNYGLTAREERLARRYFVDSGAWVLDIGCGYGRTTVPLARMGFRVIGLDVVPRMIEEARRAHPDLRWLIMSATDLALRDASVDYTLFSANGIDCIYPLERRTQALREIHRVLRPGGCLIYSAHNWIAQAATSVRRRGRRGTLWRNLLRGRLGPGYLRTPQAGGEMVLYFGTPGSEMRRLWSLGFRDVTIHSGKISPRLDGRGRLVTVLFDVWPHYVAYR